MSIIVDMIFYSSRPSKRVCFQIPHTHIRAFLLGSAFGFSPPIRALSNSEGPGRFLIWQIVLSSEEHCE